VAKIGFKNRLRKIIVKNIKAEKNILFLKNF